MSMSVKGTYVGMPSQIAVQPFSESYMKISGRIYSNVITDGEAIPSIPGANYLLAVPIVLAKQTSFSEIGIYVETNAVGGKTRIGIYNDSGFFPNSLILDSGELDCSTTGEKKTAISLTLDAGTYWLAFVCNDNNLEFNHYRGAPAMLGTVAHGGDYSTDIGDSFAFGALPATYPVAATYGRTVFNGVSLKVA